MKYVRFSTAGGAARIGVLKGDQVTEIDGFGHDMAELIRNATKARAATNGKVQTAPGAFPPPC